MKKLILSAGIAVLSGLYSVMKLFPQDKKRFVFMTRETNTPGADFLLLREQLQRDMPDCKTVMLCRRFVAAEATLSDKLSYAFHILRQMHHLSRSRAVILDTYCIPVSLFRHRKELLVIQLWHAIGSMKKFGYAMLGKGEGASPETARLMHMHRGYDYITISSKSFIKDYIEGFDTTPDKVVEIPLPKADLMTDRSYGAEKKAAFINNHPEAGKKKNILYCPTFRGNGNGSRAAIDALIACMDESKYNLIYKPHPLAHHEGLPDSVITSTWPTYDVIFAADYVISDYSSVIYEAGLAGKPIFAYAYDWDEYSKAREINFDIEHDFPGLFTKDPEAIMSAIENDDYDMERQRAFISKNVAMPRGMTCTELLSQFIISHLK